MVQHGMALENGSYKMLIANKYVVLVCIRTELNGICKAVETNRRRRRFFLFLSTL